MDESTDFVRRFLFEELDIRGAFVRLSGAWQPMVAGRNYPPSVARLLGEMAAVTVLVAGNLKQPGRLTFQLQGHGPVSLMVLDCTERLQLRGMAKHAPDLDPDAPPPQLLGDGRLALTVQPENVVRPYQSLVPLQGDSIAAVFEHFLAQSEQQPARLWLTASETFAAGLFLQKLPGAEARDPDGWPRVEALAATVQPQEMERSPLVELLTHLFPEETLRLFKPRPVAYECPKDWDKVRNLLRSLGREEVESVLREQGQVLIHDDICNHEYRFDAAAISELFGNGQSGSSS